MKLSITHAVFLSLSLSLSLMSFCVGCGKNQGGLSSDSGTMTMEEFQQAKADEQKAISEGMQSTVKKK